jgi:hypothetical protein
MIILTAVGVLILVSIYVCLSSFSTPEDKAHAAPPVSVITVTPEPTAAPTFVPVFTPEPEHISVSGSGSADAMKIHLEQGLSIFTINYPGNSVFEVWLADEMVKLNRIAYRDGGFWGRKALGIKEADDYYLVVKAGGVWTVKVDQPRPMTAQQVPASLAGTAQGVSDFFTLDAGETTFKITHDGWMNFDIWLLDSNGAPVERLVSTYGTYDGTNKVNISKTGIYLLDVQADGRWKVDISQ